MSIKPIIRPALHSLLCLGVIFLTGCGEESGSGGSNGSLTGDEINTYFPTDTSLAWYYDNDAEAVRFSGTLSSGTQILNALSQPNGTKEYFYVTSNQIALKGYYFPQVFVSGEGEFTTDFMFDSPIVLWQSSYTGNASQQIDLSGSVNIQPDYGRQDIDISGSVSYHGKESVQVPFGDYDALHVSYDLTLHATIDGYDLELPIETDLWLVEGIGIVKRIENGESQSLVNFDGKDSDGDGVSDAIDAFPSNPSETEDTDNDGIGNNADTDDDGDGVDDANDAFPTNPDEHTDTDEDGIGNNADNDDDGDGVNDDEDAFPTDASEQYDTDNDGIGNNTDPDDDNDGVVDENDAFPTDPNEQVDTDSDGIGNNADTDDDNDGYSDDVDLAPTDPTIGEPLTVDQSAFSATVIWGDVSTYDHALQINGDNLDWTLAGSEAWLSTSAASGTGDTGVTLTVDISSLGVGVHMAELTLTNLYNDTAQTVTVTADVDAPTLTLSDTSVEIDGSYNWENTDRDVQISLNTGSNSYPLSVEVSFPNNGSNPLTVSTPATASEAAGVVNLQVDPSVLTSGLHEGTLTFSADVLGVTVYDSADIQIMASNHELLIPDSAVALSDVPSGGKSTHIVDVFDSYGLTDTPWEAVSDSAWLTVTSNGTTGGSLTLAADETGLTTDTLHRATVTLSSSNPSIENTPVIQVAFWVGGTDPAETASIDSEYSELTTDPLRPYVYLHNGGTDIDVYNVYDASYVDTITDIGVTLGDMEVSADGQTLYVADTSNNSVHGIDLDNTANRASWNSSDSLGAGFTLTNTQGRELLISGYGNLYKADDGTLYAADTHTSYYGYNYLDASLFGNRFCAINGGISPFTLQCFDLDYSSYHDAVDIVSLGSIPHGTGGNGRDVALNNDGSWAYTASGSPYQFNKLSVEGDAVSTTLAADAYPNAVEIGPDEALHGGISSWYGPTDIWVYESNGALRTSGYASGYADEILARDLAVSGDGRTTIVLTDDPKVFFLRSF